MHPASSQRAHAARPLWLGPLILLAGAGFVGLAAIGLRLSAMGPQATGFWRFAFALPILAGFAAIRRIPLGRPDWRILSMGLFFGVYISVWHVSLLKTSVANSTFIVNVGSVSAGLLAWIFLRQRPGRIWPLAALITLAGAATMSFGRGHNGAGDLSGDLIASIAALLLACYVIFATMARTRSGGLSVIFWGSAAAACVMIASSAIAGEALVPSAPQDLLIPLFLALFAQTLGQGLIVYGSGLCPPSVSGIILMCQPVVSGVIAWPLFGEALSPAQILGAGTILIGVWLAGKR